MTEETFEQKFPSLIKAYIETFGVVLPQEWNLIQAHTIDKSIVERDYVSKEKLKEFLIEKHKRKPCSYDAYDLVQDIRELGLEGEKDGRNKD